MTAQSAASERLSIEEFLRLLARATDIPENRFHPFVWILGEPEIGADVYIGGFSEVNARGARVIIGDNCDIASFVSINCADTHMRCIGLSEAIARGRQLEKEGIYWFEEPIPHDDYDAYAAIARELSVPVQIGENFNGPEGMLSALSARASDPRWSFPSLPRCRRPSLWPSGARRPRLRRP